MISGLFSLALGFLILYVCYSAGRYVLSLAQTDLRAPEESVFAAALGFGILAYAVLGAGLAGFLSLEVLWSILGIFLFAAFFRLPSDLENFKVLAKFFSGSWTLGGVLVGAASAAAFVMILAGLLVPEIANDSLCYHLHIPKIYLQNQRIF